MQVVKLFNSCTVKILNIGTCMSEQTVKILIRLLWRSSLIRIYTVCHSFYIFWRHYFIVKLNCFILRTTTVAGLGVPIFRVFTVIQFMITRLCSTWNCLPSSLWTACSSSFTVTLTNWKNSDNRLSLSLLWNRGNKWNVVEVKITQFQLKILA